jgi:energy-coupling factor transport system ATP-binding protein
MPVEVTNLSYTYRNAAGEPVDALDDVTLHIDDGEFVGLIGRTGCGKSTLLQLIAGLDVPSGGTVFLDGDDINAARYNRTTLRERIGIVFQFPEIQLFSSTVEADVAFGLRQREFSGPEIKLRTSRALETMGFDFETVRGLSPFVLSGGEKRRAAVAGVLAGDPGILLLDEPLAGVDSCFRRSFMKMICELNKSGKTIIMVSHNMDVLGEYAERIIVLDAGKVIADDRPPVIFSDRAYMQSLHLCVSEPRRIADKLLKAGVPVSTQITGYRELLDELTTVLSGKDTDGEA